jgi:hypothetical protein
MERIPSARFENFLCVVPDLSVVNPHQKNLTAEVFYKAGDNPQTVNMSFKRLPDATFAVDFRGEGVNKCTGFALPNN